MGGDVRLMMSERRLLVKVEAERYRKARKKEKGRILDDLIALSGYNRWYAVGLLRGHGKAIKVGRRLRLVGDLGRSTQRRRPRIYDGVVLGAQEDLGDPGLRLRQTAGGDYSRGGSGVGAPPRDRAGCGNTPEALFDQPRHDRSPARTGAPEIRPSRPRRHQTRDAAQ